MIKKIVMLLCFLFSLSVFSTLADDKNNLNVSNNAVEDKDWTVKLDEALKAKNYRTASIIAGKENSAALIGRLKPWAEANDTVAQWLYAQSLYDEKRYEESAKWTYIAFFFTRYDESLCTNTEALGLEKSIVDNYFNIVEKSRSNQDTIDLAVSDTITYLNNINEEDLSGRNPKWICELTNKLPDTEWTIPEAKWNEVFQIRLRQFIETTTGKKEKTNNTADLSNSDYDIGKNTIDKTTITLN